MLSFQVRDLFTSVKLTRWKSLLKVWSEVR